MARRARKTVYGPDVTDKCYSARQQSDAGGRSGDAIYAPIYLLHFRIVIGSKPYINCCVNCWSVTKPICCILQKSIPLLFQQLFACSLRRSHYFYRSAVLSTAYKIGQKAETHELTMASTATSGGLTHSTDQRRDCSRHAPGSQSRYGPCCYRNNLKRLYA